MAAAPLERLGDIWAIVFFSLLTALWVLVSYRLVSPQARITAAKSRILAHFLGVYLFRDYPRQVLKVQAALFGSIGRYLLYSLPALFLVVPAVVLLFVQLQLRYGWSPPAPGEEVTVNCRWSPAGTGEIELELPPAVELRGAPVRIRRLRRISWRLVPLAEGAHTLVFRRDGERVEKVLHCGPPPSRLYPLTGPPEFETLLLYPGQDFLKPDSGFERLEVEYPGRTVAAAGLRAHWLVWYFAVTVIFALALKKPLKVDF